MAKMTWADTTPRLYDAGIDRGVLNVTGTTCVPWSGLVSVTDSTENAEPDLTYYDGVKIQHNLKPSDYTYVLSAMYSPVEFDECDGTLAEEPGLFSTHNSPKEFNFSYRSGLGDHDYRLHFIYNSLAVPSDRQHETLGKDVEVEPLSWGVTTRPLFDEGVPRRAHFYMDTTKTNPVAIALAQQMLYGTKTTSPKFPTYSDLKAMIQTTDKVVVRSLSNGRWSITADDEYVELINTVKQLFELDWVGANMVGHGLFNIKET